MDIGIPKLERKLNRPELSGFDVIRMRYGNEIAARFLREVAAMAQT